MIVINIELGDFTATDRVDESLCSVVVDSVVLELKFFKCRAAVDEVADHQATLRSNTVLREIQAVQLLLLLVLKRTCHDTDSFIADLIAAKIQLTNCLTALKDTFEFVKAFNSNVILAKGKYFQIALLTESTSKGQSSIWEDSIARKPNLSDVLCVLDSRLAAVARLL